MDAKGFNPDDYINQKASAFDPDSYLQEKTAPQEPTEPEKTPVLVSAVRKFGQGLSGGLSDELAGVAEASGKLVGIEPVKQVPGQLYGLDALGKPNGGLTTDWEVLKDAYKRGRDQERADLKKDSKDNPLVSGVVEVTGAVLSPANKIAKGAGLIKQGAIVGGVTGAGNSEAEDLKGLAKDTAFGGVVGGAVGGAIVGGKHLLKGKQAPKIISELTTEKADDAVNADEVRQAAKRLGFEPTRGMLTKDMTTRGLESSLEQSPTVGGALVRKSTLPVREGLEKASGKILETTPISKYEAGEAAKSGILSKLGEKLDPLKASYDDLQRYTKDMVLTPKSKTIVVRNIRNIEGAGLSPETESIVARYAKSVENATSADDIKRIKTLVRQHREGTTGLERQVLSDVESKLRNLEQRQILRSSVASAKTPAEGKQVAKEISGQLRETNKGYREVMQGMKEFANDAKLGKPQSYGDFSENISSMRSEELANKLFNINDVRTLEGVRKTFPDVFNKLKQQRLTEISKDSLTKGQLDPVKFVNNVKKLSPEAKQVIFGEHATTLKDLETVINSLPTKMGPSGTPQGMQFLDMFKLTEQGHDALRYGRYMGAEKAAKETVTGAGKKVSDGIKSLGGHESKALQGLFQRLQSESKGTEEKKKGTDKWAQDGAVKLKDHGLSPQVIDTLSKTEKGKRILVQASDLKVNSRAMNQLVSTIKEQ